MKRVEIIAAAIVCLSGAVQAQWQTLGTFTTSGNITKTGGGLTSGGRTVFFEYSSDCVWCGTSTVCFAQNWVLVDYLETPTGLTVAFSYASGASSSHWRNVAVFNAEGNQMVPCFDPTSFTNCVGWGFQGGYPVVGESQFEFVEPGSVSYCTPGVSSLGCQAVLSTSGAASATAGSGFVLAADGAEGAKFGVFFFGTNGRQANPFGNGTSFLCVVPPVVRTGALAGSGTAGSCNGSAALDLNAAWCSGCPKEFTNPGSGAVVQAQYWYRDPQNTSNQQSALSDAVEFSVCP